MSKIYFRINHVLKAAKVVLLLLFVFTLFSCNKENKDNNDNIKYAERVNNIVNIDGDIIKENGDKDYVVDTNGKEQVILDNIFDANVGEVVYFGEIGGAKIPFVVVRRNNDLMEIMSIPKFNLLRDNSFDSLNKMAIAESYSLLNTVFLRTCFNEKEIENIIPFEYREINLQIEPDKEILSKFDIVYDQNYNDKYDHPTILSKILLHQNYVNRLYNNTYIEDYGEPSKKNSDKIMSSIDNMWNCVVTDTVKGVTYSYDYKDYVYETGIDFYEYNTRIELRLKNIETDRYKRKANGFKHIATSSDLEEKDYGCYFFRDGKIVTDEKVENDGIKYYLSNTGKAIELKNFNIQDFDGTKVLMCDDVIVRDKVISRDEITIDENESLGFERLYVDVNGIIHKLVNDIKEAGISDTVEFGHDSNDINRPLLWRVVDNINGVYTLILESKIKLNIININAEKRDENIYDGRVSNFDDGNTWDQSDRRKFLNEKFYNEAFSDNEKEIIVSNLLHAESYINERYFSGKGKDVYDKVFIYNENTTEYMKKYSALFEMFKAKKPSIYNDEDLDLNFSLTDSDMKSVRPWTVVNVSGISIPNDEHSTDFVDTKNNDLETYEIPKINNKGRFQIKFGKYLLFGSEKTNIYWNMIAVDGNIAYFVASEVLDFENIAESRDKEIKWSNSELRKWLNQTFIHKIFNDSEILKLKTIKKNYNYLDSSGSIKEEECEDFITLLNYDEVPIYLTSGVRLSNKSFEKIDSIDRDGTAAATSSFDNRSHKFYSACYKADQFGDYEILKTEIKINSTDYVGILPVVALNIYDMLEFSVNQKIRKNVEGKDELVDDKIKNSQFLFKEGLYGDVIKMGKYQNKDLEWVILDRKRDYALVMAKNSLFNENILGKFGISSWETSNVREKLNTEIYNDCFSDEEKKRIKPVRLFTEYTESDIRSELDYRSDPLGLIDDETIDYLFLPGERDINIIVKKPLKTAYNEGEEIWLRNGDMNGFYVSNFNEVVDLNINRKTKKYNVRPLMWIKY